MRKDAEMITRKLDGIAGAVVVAGMLVLGTQAHASYMIEWQDGPAGKDFLNWSSEELNGGTVKETTTSGSVGLGGDADTALILDPNTGGDGTVYRDVHFTTASDLIANGNLSAWGDNDLDIYGMQFDFYAGADGEGNGGAPLNLGFYFASENAGEEHVWYYNIGTDYITDGWATYGVAFDFNYSNYGQSGWYGFQDNSWFPSLDATDFANDISTDGVVDRLGVWIAYDTFNDDQIYGIDDFGLTVPEPETYLVLGMALLSIAVVFRKRISDSLADARAMMHA